MQTHLCRQSALGAMCGNMPPTISIPCVKTGLAPLCLGLYYNQVPERDGSSMTSSRRTKGKSEAGMIESAWEERSGAEQPPRRGRPGVSADVTAVTILEVNKLNLEREDRELGGTLVGGRLTVVWKL